MRFSLFGAFSLPVVLSLALSASANPMPPLSTLVDCQVTVKCPVILGAKLQAQSHPDYVSGPIPSYLQCTYDKGVCEWLQLGIQVQQVKVANTWCPIEPVCENLTILNLGTASIYPVNENQAQA